MLKLLLSVFVVAASSVAIAATVSLQPVEMSRATTGDFRVLLPAMEKNINKIVQANTRDEEDGMQNFDFTLAYSPYTMTAMKNAVGTEIIQAFEMSAELATVYAGATVKSINFYNPVNSFTDTNNIPTATLYMFDKVGGNIIMSQKVDLSDVGRKYNTFELEKPYTIEAGKSFVVGFGIIPVDYNDFYITVDGMVSETPGGCYLGVVEENQIQWMNASMDVGNICMGITLESDSFPQNGVGIYSVTAPENVLLDTPFSTTLYIVGETPTTVNEVEVEYTIGDSAPKSLVWHSSKPFNYHDIVEESITDLILSEVGTYTITFTVTKVNGKPNTSLSASHSITLRCIDPNIGYARKFVVEEGTGTWCGFCPAGIVFMEYLKENYPDVIRVAVHSDDKMEVPSGSALLQIYTGFPQLYVNRVLGITPTESDTYSKFDSYYKEYIRIPSLMEITDLYIEPVSERQMRIKAKVRFAIDTNNEDNRYGIAFSITEDGMGPYVQTNYYAANRYGAMGGWERKGSGVPTYYDDVLRVYAGGLGGFGNMFPAQIKGGEEYELETIVYVSNIESEDFHLNALAIDNDNGEIVNAKQVVASKSSINSLSAATAGIVAEEYYNLNGIKIENPSKGIFIKHTVFADGSEHYEKAYFSE